MPDARDLAYYFAARVTRQVRADHEALDQVQKVAEHAQQTVLAPPKR